MKIAKPIDSDPEVRQAAFTAMREMANLVMDNAGFDGWSDYPWEAIDNMQQHLEAAQDSGDAARVIRSRVASMPFVSGTLPLSS